MNKNKQGALAALNDLLQSAKSLLQNPPVNSQKSFSQTTYMGLLDSCNKCEEFISQQEFSFIELQELTTQKYYKYFDFFEPIVSLQIIDTISKLIDKDCKKICVFCGTKHALLLDKLLNENFIFTKNSDTSGPKFKDADKEDLSSLKKLLDTSIF